MEGERKWDLCERKTNFLVRQRPKHQESKDDLNTHKNTLKKSRPMKQPNDIISGES